jgi:hypothetical protein
MERIRNGEEAVPLGPTCGEWTLYSTSFLRGHHATYTELWTERFSQTWCASTLRLGCPRGNGTSVEAICSLAVLVDGGHFNIKFPYKTPYHASLEGQFNNGFHERYDVEDIGLTFLGGVYLRMSIPAAALGGAAEHGGVFFFGILDRTQEMVGCPASRKRGPLPYFEALYVAASALPNARRRYQAPSSSGSTGLRLNPQAQEFIPKA